MRKHILSIKSCIMLSISIILCYSCVKPYDLDRGKDEHTSTVGSFDFATTSDYKLNVNYNTNNYQILFEVYLENPIAVIEGAQVKKEGLEPIFRAITDDQGRFNDVVHSPNYIKQVYIYTQYVGLPTVALVSVEGKTINLDLSTKKSLTPAFSKGIESRGLVRGDIKTLGDWNLEGTPDYLLSRIKLTGELMNNIMYSIPESKNGIGYKDDPHGLIFEEKAIGDLKIIKDTKINLICMHEGASMHNVLGYYCFPTNNPPKSPADVARVAAFPNFSLAYSGGELSSGDRVQLKYWDGTQFQETFPAGTTIGWFIISSGFRKPQGEINGLAQTIYYSNTAWNGEIDGMQHCVAMRDGKDKIIALGFEDQNRKKLASDGGKLSDSDFNDAVFYIETSALDGIDDSEIPDIAVDPSQKPDESDNYIKYSGSLAFEDLWPSKGDYDMNDVVIDYECIHYRNAKNLVVKIVDKFTPKWTGGSIKSGFGYQLGTLLPSNISKMTIESEYNSEFKLFKTNATGLELGQKYATVVLCENVYDVLGDHIDVDNLKSFTVTIELTSPTWIGAITPPPYNPFIVCGARDANHEAGIRYKEVHLPNKAPTDLADKGLLGRVDDRSNILKGIYYVAEDNYVFGLNIPVTFDYPREKENINDAYRGFRNWVNSNGATDADWYLYRNK